MCACMTISSVSMPVYGADYIEQSEAGENEQTVPETENTEEKGTEQTESGELDTNEGSEDLEEPKEEETEQEQSGEASDNSDEMSAEDENKEIQTFSSDVINSGTCGENAKWTYYADKTLVISGSGPMKSYTYDWREYISTAPWMAYRSRIKKIVVEDGITSIGDYAFKECGYGLPGQCTALEEIVIGNDVEEIGKEAFNSCNPITVEPIQSVFMGAGVKRIAEDAFRTTGRIKKVEIPSLENWMQIDFANEASTPMWGGAFPRDNEEVAFYVGGVRTKNVIIPEGITEIKDYTFWNCRLNSVEWSQQETVNRIGVGAFAYNDFKKIDIPTSVTTIDWNAFRSCVDLKKIELSDQIEKINGQVFCEDSSLETVGLPSKIESISAGLFSGCTSLANIEIPNSVKNIGNWAFNGCDVLQKIEIPKQVESIGTGAFYKCNALKSLEIPDSVKTIGDYAFAKEENLETILLPYGLKVIENATFQECSNLKTIQIPNSIEKLGDSAFEKCSSLQSISGGENITSVGTRVFSGCSQLQSVTIFPKISTINTSMFGGCKNLTHIVFPDKLIEIKSGAFSGCAFSDITVPDTVTSLEAYAFSSCTNLKRIQCSKELTTIGERCFSDCTALDEIVIPDRVRSLGQYVFSGCKNLSKITFEGDAPEISSYAFAQVKATCYYPKGNTTYTAEIITQDFGGDLIWTYEGEEADSDANKCGEHITWTLSESGELVLSGSGEMYDYSLKNLEYAPWYEVRKKIKSIQISDGITHIGAYAFYKCENVTTVNTLPNSITTIGAYAFSWCHITEIELPDNLENITDGMLDDCRYLKKVTFPKKLKIIGKYAFSMCVGLNSVEIPEGVVSIGDGAFAACGNYTSWGEYYPSSSFISVKLPSTLQSLGNNVFRWCTSLQTINIPGKTVEVGNGAFSYCYNLSNVTFEWSVPKLASDIFDICKNTTITCYYPSNNPEWTADKLQNYKAYKVNWIAKEMTKPAEGGGSGGSGSGGTGTGSGESGSGSDSGSGTGSGGGGSGSGSGSDSGNSGSGSSSGGSSSGGGSESGGGSSGGSGTGGSGSGSGGNESGDSGNAGGSGSEITLGYTAHSLTLNGDIGVNFYLELNDAIIKDSSAVMQMEVNSQKVSEIKVSDVVKNGTTEVTDEEGTTHACYKFTCNVYAKQMNDTIQATLKTSSGTWKETYSIKKYVEQAQESSNENLKELVNAMSNYGIWAQKLLEYNTDNLTEDSLPDVSQVTADQLTAYTYVENGSEDNLKVYGSSLLLKEKTSIRMYYSLKSGTIQDYTFKIDGNEVVPVKSGNNGLYYVEIDNIAAQDLDKVHTFTVGKLEISNYSVLSYIGKALKSEKSSENNKNTAAALYLYWNAAEKYFEK